MSSWNLEGLCQFVHVLKIPVVKCLLLWSAAVSALRVHGIARCVLIRTWSSGSNRASRLSFAIGKLRKQCTLAIMAETFAFNADIQQLAWTVYLTTTGSQRVWAFMRLVTVLDT